MNTWNNIWKNGQWISGTWNIMINNKVELIGQIGASDFLDGHYIIRINGKMYLNYRIGKLGSKWIIRSIGDFVEDKKFKTLNEAAEYLVPIILNSERVGKINNIFNEEK